MRLRWRAVVVVLLAGNVASCQWVPGTPQHHVQRAKSEVATQLRDPRSAQFRDVTTNGLVVCGEVNGRNAYGAYAGYGRFVFDGLIAHLEPPFEGPVTVDNVAEAEAYTAFLKAFNDCKAGS